MSGYYGQVHVKASWRNQTEIRIHIDDRYDGQRIWKKTPMDTCLAIVWQAAAPTSNVDMPEWWEK
jgi:hypothetical protein